MGRTIAAAVVAPSLAGAGQHAGHVEPPVPAGQAAGSAAVPPEPDRWPRALDDHERATLAVIGEQIVPGSAAAGVPALIDRVLAVEPPDELRRFRNALGAFEHAARTRHARPWLALSDAERLALLEEAAAAAPAVPPDWWQPGKPVVPDATKAPAPPPTMRDHFDRLKETVSRPYYTTEVGATELGWTGMEFWERLPGCRR